MLVDCETCQLIDKCDQEDRWYGCINYKPRPQTNGDRIRAMTDEELAEFLNSLLDGCDFEGCPAYVGCHSLNPEMCVEHLEEWLRQEYKE